MKKSINKELAIAYTLIGLLPPLGILFIVVDWFKGAKINFTSFFGVILGVILTIVYYLQLTSYY